jgi:hypothetical protein
LQRHYAGSQCLAGSLQRSLARQQSLAAGLQNGIFTMPKQNLFFTIIAATATRRVVTTFEH